MQFNLNFLKKLENKQKALIAALIAVIFATIVILYFYFFAGPQALPAPEEQVAPLGTINLNINVLDNEVFKSLEKIGDYPAQPPKEDEVSRENPFTPY